MKTVIVNIPEKEDIALLKLMEQRKQETPLSAKSAYVT